MALLSPSGAPRIISISDDDAVTAAASMLRQGQVVALPTDTVYGYAATIARDDAIQRIYLLKSRLSRKAIPVLLSDKDQTAMVVREMPAQALSLADAFWPGGLTLVLAAQDGLHLHLTSAETGIRTVAVRVPNLDFAREVIAALGGALAVTSANRSGERPALDAAEIDREFPHAPDAIVDGGRVKGGIASTIVRITDQGVEILREGAIPTSTIKAVLARHGPY